MKLKYDFEIVQLDGNYMAVPVGDDSIDTHMVLRLNETAAEIIKMLKSDTTESLIVESILSKYEGNKDEIQKAVHDYIELLMNEELISV